MEPRNPCEKICVYELQRLPLLAKWWEDTFQKIGVDLRLETEAKEIMENIPYYIVDALRGLRHSPFLSPLMERVLHVEGSHPEKNTTQECESKIGTDDTTYVEVPQSGQKPVHSKRRKSIPFLEFLKRRHPKIWRGVPQAKSFHDKADTLMKKIVQDFVSWVNNKFDGDEIDEILFEDVFAMFQYDKSIIRFLRIEQVGLESVPDDSMRPGDKQYYQSSRLRREILRDAEAFNRPKKTVAFGRCLPPELRSTPTRDTNFIKFMTCDASKRMRTLEGLFSGYTNLASIKNYCEFLKENHPEVVLPNIVTSDEVYQQEACLWMKQPITPTARSTRKSSMRPSIK